MIGFGSVVRLVSGGPKMVVKKETGRVAGEATFQTQWFDCQGHLHEANFIGYLLQEVMSE